MLSRTRFIFVLKSKRFMVSSRLMNFFFKENDRIFMHNLCTYNKRLELTEKKRIDAEYKLAPNNRST